MGNWLLPGGMMVPHPQLTDEIRNWHAHLPLRVALNCPPNNTVYEYSFFNDGQINAILTINFYG